MMATVTDAELDLTLMAMADPTRRSILARLSDGEARVTEVARPFALSLNAISKHIRVLERAGLVRRRRVGREHLISLDPAPLARTSAWIESQRAAWVANLDALDRLLQEEDRVTASVDEAAQVGNDLGRRRFGRC